MYLTDKQKVKRFADMIEAMPTNEKFIVLFDKLEVRNLQGERILSFGVKLFDKIEVVDAETVDSTEPTHALDAFNYLCRSMIHQIADSTSESIFVGIDYGAGNAEDSETTTNYKLPGYDETIKGLDSLTIEKH